MVGHNTHANFRLILDALWIPSLQSDVIVLEELRVRILQWQIRTYPHLRLADRDILSNNVTDVPSFRAHRCLKVLGLFLFRLNFCINLFLLCNEIICRLFCLSTQSLIKNPGSPGTIWFAHLFLGGNFFLNLIDLLSHDVHIIIHCKKYTTNPVVSSQALQQIEHTHS